MNPLVSSLAAAAAVGLASLLFIPAGPAQAQARSEAEIRQQLLADRAACEARHADEERRRACLREAGAAAQAARQGELAHGQEDFRRNALARCAPLPPGGQREACELRVKGAGTVTGSVEEGGLFRELRIQVPASQAETPMAAPSTAPSTAVPSTAPGTTVVPSTTPPPTVVAPGTTGAPAAPAVGAPGRPTFTPVQPVVPGRTAPAPAAVPASPAAGSGMSGTPGVGAPPASLQVSPPATPVTRTPVAPAPSTPQPVLVVPGSVPAGSAR